MALDTSGYPIAATGQGGLPLANLAPLQFRAQPLTIQPLAGWSIPNTNQQAVASGISSAASSIAQGIQVAYQSRQEQKRLDAEKAARNAQFQQEEQDRKDRIAIEQKSLDARIAKAGGNKGNSAPFIDAAQPSSPQDTTTPAPPVGTDATQKTLPDEELDREIEQLPNKDNAGHSAPGDLPSLDQDQELPKSPLADLTSPVPATASTGSNALASLSGTDWSQVPDQSKTASLSGVPQQSYTPPASQSPVGSLSGVGAPPALLPNVSDDQLGRIDNALANVTNPASAPEQTQSASTAVPIPGPFQSIKAAQMEADKNYDGYEPRGTVRYNPKIGGYVVDRPAMKQETIEAEKDRNANQAAQKDVRDQRLGIQMNNSMERRANDYLTKNIFPRKIEAGRGALAGFLAAYKTGQTSGNRNITDLDLADNYIAFARGASSPTGAGGQITEGQYEELKSNGSLWNKLEKAVNSKATGEFLSDADRKTMLKTMVEAYNAQAVRENGKLGQFRKAMLSDYPDIPKEKIPNDYPLLKTPEETEKDINDTVASVREIAKGKSKEELAQDSQYQEALQHLRSLSEDKNSGIPSNADEVNNTTAGVQAGMFGGTAPLVNVGTAQ